MAQHRALDGTTIDYPELGPAPAAYLERVLAAAEDSRVSPDALHALVAFGKSHPKLDAAVHPVLEDAIARKLAQHTLTVTEAADLLGVHPSSVQKAVEAGKLPAVKNGRRWLFAPRDVEHYGQSRGSGRGPKPGQSRPLEAQIARTRGASFRIKAVDVQEVKREPGYVQLRIAIWQSAAVIFGPKGSLRMWVLKPGRQHDEVKFGDSYVRGRFTVVEKVNNVREASRRWRSFKPS